MPAKPPRPQEDVDALVGALLANQPKPPVAPSLPARIDVISHTGHRITVALSPEAFRLLRGSLAEEALRGIVKKAVRQVLQEGANCRLSGAGLGWHGDSDRLEDLRDALERDGDQ